MPALTEKLFQDVTGKDLDSPIFSLSKQLEENRSLLVDYLETRHVKFAPAFESATQLSNRVKTLLQELDDISSTVENKLLDAVTAPAKRDALHTQISELKCEAEVIEKLLQVDNILSQLSKMNPRDPKEFENFASLIVEGEELLSSLTDLKELEIIPVLQLELANLKSDLTSVLIHLWHDLVSWQNYETEYEATLVLQQIENLPKLVVILENIGEYSLIVRQFSRKLFENILKHLPVKQCDLIQKKSDGTVHLRVRFKPSAPTFDEVRNNLLTLLSGLHDILGSYTVEMLGNLWKSQICELVVEKILAPAVPSSAEELQSFDNFISQTVELEDGLKSVGFLSQDDNMLSDYVQNVNFLYANKLCQEVLSSARKIIAMDLHDTVRLGLEDVGLIASTYQSKGSEEWEVLASLGIDVNKSPFLFPECTISKSTVEILQLMRSTLIEAARNGPELSSRLDHVCRSVVDLYISTLPVVHKGVLANLPQHSALAHNNCMYFGHFLMTINAGSLPFVMQAQSLRQLGAQIFLAQMRTQKSHLLTMLNDGGLNRLGIDASLGPALEKAFRQCMLHLKHLQQVWQPVLPDTVYGKAIGTLTNSVLEETVTRITSVEDIPAGIAVSLVAHGSFITAALPNLFRVGEENDAEVSAKLCRFVSRFEQFKELLKLLDASLKDVEDRWANGSGPLALYFTADQLNQRIDSLTRTLAKKGRNIADEES